MSLCASCGTQLSGADVAVGACGHHGAAYDADWHVTNRIMCGFFHRQDLPPRLPESQREVPGSSSLAEIA